MKGPISETLSLYSSALRHNDEKACLPPGDYRIDFYLNGNLALTQYKSGSFGVFEPTRWREMGISFCRPADWQAWVDSKVPDTDLVRGMQTKSGKPAIFAFTFLAPAELPGFKDRNGYFLDQAKQRLVDLGILPADPASPLLNADEQCDDLPAHGWGYRVWSANEGWIHVAFLSLETPPAGEACNMLLSIDNDNI